MFVSWSLLNSKVQFWRTSVSVPRVAVIRVCFQAMRDTRAAGMSRSTGIHYSTHTRSENAKNVYGCRGRRTRTLGTAGDVRHKNAGRTTKSFFSDSDALSCGRETSVPERTRFHLLLLTLFTSSKTYPGLKFLAAVVFPLVSRGAVMPCTFFFAHRLAARRCATKPSLWRAPFTPDALFSFVFLIVLLKRFSNASTAAVEFLEISNTSVLLCW